METQQEIEIITEYPHKDTNFTQLKQYRSGLYSILGQRKDASMDLIDALACNKQASSVTELSEEPEFVRQYASVRDAIHYASHQQKELTQHMQTWGISQMPQMLIDEQKYHVYIVDSTPNPHPHANRLKDRTIIHDASRQLTGKPINIGHQYSAIVGVTEDSSWVSPIRMERVPSDQKATEFGVQQALQVCAETDEKSIVLFDSAYNNTACRKMMIDSNTKCIMIVRSACNRKYYMPAKPEDYKGRGCRPHYGDVIDLYHPTQGALPDECIQVKPNGHPGHIELFYWRTTYTKMKGMKGYTDPSALVVLIEYREDGSWKHQKPWVVRVFDPYDQLNSAYGAWLYSFRYSIERYFSVQKKNLLFDRFRSPEVEHQQTFCLMGSLAYQEWYLAKMQGDIEIPVKPWMRYPKHNPKGLAVNPSNIQRGFSNVLKWVGTPSVYRPPTTRPPGRKVGETQEKRPIQPVIKKSEKASKQTVVESPKSPGMSADIRNEGAKIAGEVAGQHKSSKNIKSVLIGLLLAFIVSFWSSNDFDYSEKIVQKVVMAPTEIAPRDSDGGLIRYQKSMFSALTRGPPIVG